MKYQVQKQWMKIIQQEKHLQLKSFQIKSTKLYVTVVTLSINKSITFLENIKQRFKRTISWNKYRSEITTKLKNNNWDYMIDSTFRNINRLFVLSLKNGSNDPTKNSFDQYYITLMEIKNFNALINNKPFFDQPVKNKQEYKKLVKLSRQNDYKRRNLLDYLCHQKHKTYWYRFIKTNKYDHSSRN